MGSKARLVALLVAIVFTMSWIMLPGYTAKAFAQAQQPQKGAAQAGGEGGAATAAGISTGTIVAAVIAAAAIAAVAASAGGGGGAEEVSTAVTPQTVASGLASTGLSTDQMLALNDSFNTGFSDVGGGANMADILAQISYEDLQAALSEMGLLAADKNTLKQYLAKLQGANPSLYNRLVAALKVMAQNKTLFQQVQTMVKSTESLAQFQSAIQNQVQTMLTQQHPGYTVQFTTLHHGGGIYTTTAHLIKQ